jgi:N-acylneuraminate cytidylyltransferase
MFDPTQAMTRSQDLEPAFHDAGQFYWGTKAAWREGRAILGPASSVVQLPAHRVQDIDTDEDWRRAELLFSALRGEQAP